MNRFLYLSGSILLLSCAWGVIRVAEALRASIRDVPVLLAHSVDWGVDRITDRTAVAVDGAARRLEIQAALLRSETLMEVREARIHLTETVGLLPGLVDARAGRLESIADRRLGEALATVDMAAASVQDVTLRAGPVLNHAAALLEHAGGVARQVDEAAPLWLDCESNPSCAFNRYAGVAKAAEVSAQETAETMRAIRAATPQVLTNLDKTTANVERLTRPDHLWLRIGRAISPALGGLVLGAMK
jgi:hypothetical protein